MAKIETIEITIQEKPELNGKIYKPVNGSKFPAILFSHGLASCQEEFSETPKIIAQKGYVCMTFDYSGHGKSKGPIGYITENGHLFDIKRAIEFLKTQSFVKKEKLLEKKRIEDDVEQYLNTEQLKSQKKFNENKDNNNLNKVIKLGIKKRSFILIFILIFFKVFIN